MLLRERMAECRVSPGKTRVLIGDAVFRQIKPELMYPHKAHQKISVSGLTVEDLLIGCRMFQNAETSSCWSSTSG